MPASMTVESLLPKHAALRSNPPVLAFAKPDYVIEWVRPILTLISLSFFTKFRNLVVVDSNNIAFLDELEIQYGSYELREDVDSC
jgi:hypothetical protein